jgi:DNA mismatch repair protein MutL
MADRIKLLPDSIANQIAAGEVVNRPASVVKEMLENAVDAGAKNITVNFRDGGTTLIQIVDDGAGMSPIDARMAFDRHATSKISSVEDIYTLHTFGFRGEALASIAAVAEVELRTRRSEDELGTLIEINGGKFVRSESVSCPVGSQFMVKNLFYNVPARRRFIDKSTTEARHIVAEYKRVALCNTEIAFSLYNNDALVSKLPPAPLAQRIVGVVGKHITTDLLEIGLETTIAKIHGFIGRPSSATKNKREKDEQYMFVNGRFFRSPFFHKAVMSAYEKLIPAGTQPSYFLYFDILPERIDVNVHPQKTEVKFEEGGAIWQMVLVAVREALAKSGAVPFMDFDMDTTVEIPPFRESQLIKEPEVRTREHFNPFEDYGDIDTGGARHGVAKDFNGSYNIDDGAHETDEEHEIYDSSIMEFIEGDEATQGHLDMPQEQSGETILTIAGRYAFAARGSAVLVVDLRRAAEAVMYERYINMLKNDSSITQSLMFPERVPMSIDDIMFLTEHIHDFRKFGFNLHVADEYTVEIAGVPGAFMTESAVELLYDLLDALREDESGADDMRMMHLAAIMAYKSASAGAGKWSSAEAERLINELMMCANSSFTPSGKMVMTSLSEEDIKRLLKI